jgi:membrane fusion protein, heavy metal efflux system
MSQTIRDDKQVPGSEEPSHEDASRASTEPVSPQQSEPLERPAVPRSLLVSIAGTLPSLFVVMALVGLGYWGHHVGWKLPKFSELNGAITTQDDDWCAEHGVLESQCVECKPDKFPKPKDYGWCQEHGVHQCPFDHPDVAQVKNVTPLDETVLKRVTHALELRPRAANNSACTSYQRRIQFASHDCVLKAGVDVEPVVTGPITEVVHAGGEMRYDSTRVAPLSSKAAGTVWRVYKEVGEPVRQGEVIALVDAAEVGRFKAELVTAMAEQDLHAGKLRRLKGIDIPASKLQETETDLKKARTRVLGAQQGLLNLGLSVSLDALQGLSEDELASRIRLLGLPDSVANQLDSTTTTSNLIAVISRLDGIVISRDVVADQVVDTAKMLFKVADTSRLWLFLNVPVEEAAFIKPGQQVQFRPDGSAEEVPGIVTWVNTAVDPITRTVEVRANLDNSAGRLRAETFGTGRILLREEPNALLVPSEAVQWDGSCFVVFVRDKSYFAEGSPKVFHTRSVRPGVQNKQVTEIIAGLVPQEVVATRGSGVLRAQLLKNNIGAG